MMSTEIPGPYALYVAHKTDTKEHKRKLETLLHHAVVVEKCDKCLESIGRLNVILDKIAENQGIAGDRDYYTGDKVLFTD